MEWVINTIKEAFNLNPRIDVERNIKRGIFYDAGFTLDKLPQFHNPYGENIFWFRSKNNNIIFDHGYWKLLYTDINTSDGVKIVRFTILAYPNGPHLGYVSIIDNKIYIDP